MSTRRRCLLAALVAATAIVGACSASDGDTQVLLAEQSSALPFTSIRDWVGYASAVVVGTVESEERVTSPTAAPEQTIDRRVTVRVDRTLWAARGASVPEKMTFFSGEGWVARPEGEARLELNDAPYLDLGKQYVLAMVLVGDEWGTMPASRFEVVDGRVRLSSRHDERHEVFRDMTLERLSQRLAETRPDPVVSKYDHLPAIERAAAVQKERDSTEG